MDLGSLKPGKGSKKNKKRVGRGCSSGVGKTCGRGHKGQKSRSGGMKGTGFEGGQTPIYRRLPKRGEFKNAPFKKEYSVLNLKDLSRFKEKALIVDFVNEGLLRGGKLLKILSVGALKHPLVVEAHAFSKNAKEKIESAGGKAVLLGNKARKQS